MPQIVNCSGCNEILYQHPTELKPLYKIIESYGGRCPKCGKELKFDNIADVRVSPAPEEQLEIIPSVPITEKERKYEVPATTKLTTKPSDLVKTSAPITKGEHKEKNDIRAKILADTNGKYTWSYDKKHFNDLISMGYIEKDTRILTETGRLFLQAYESVRKLKMGEDVEEGIVLKNEETEEILINLLENIKHRGVYDIYGAILIGSKEPKSPFGLIKAAHTNHKLMKKYLPRLIEAQLIEKVDNKFKTTAKGLDYINHYLYFVLFSIGGKNEDKWEITEISD